MRARATAAGRRRPLPDPGDKTLFVRAMFDAIADRYDLVNRIMTLGLDRGWRRRSVASLGIAAGATILDLGCGTGDLLREAERRQLRAVGVDLSLEMLRGCRGVSSPLVHGDAACLPLCDRAVDAAVSGFTLRNFADLDAVFAELARVVRPGGRIALLEVDRPTNPLLRMGHSVWFQRVVPVIGAALSDAAAYRYLPASVAYLPNDRELERRLEGAGFTEVAKARLAGGVAQIVTARRRAGGR